MSPYKRRTTRPVQVIGHYVSDSDPHRTLCGMWQVDYEPAPTTFLPGQSKPDAVRVGCPYCEAALACMQIEQEKPDLVAQFAQTRQTKKTN